MAPLKPTFSSATQTASSAGESASWSECDFLACSLACAHGLMHAQALAKLDFTTADQVLLIGDYGGAKPTAASKATAKELSKMFAAHYPELLYRHLFLNVRSTPLF